MKDFAKLALGQFPFFRRPRRQTDVKKVGEPQQPLSDVYLSRFCRGTLPSQLRPQLLCLAQRQPGMHYPLFNQLRQGLLIQTRQTIKSVPPPGQIERRRRIQSSHPLTDYRQPVGGALGERHAPRFPQLRPLAIGQPGLGRAHHSGQFQCAGSAPRPNFPDFVNPLGERTIDLASDVLCTSLKRFQAGGILVANRDQACTTSQFANEAAITSSCSSPWHLRCCNSRQ